MEEESPRSDWLDSSKVDAFNLCPQRYAYRYEQHLVPVDRKRDSAILFGTAIHRALETIYRGTAFADAECPLGPCNRCKGNAIPNISAVFLKHYQDDLENPKEIRTVDRGLEALELYLSKWRREPFKVLAVEQPFELDFVIEAGPGCDRFEFKYIGRIDLIAEHDGTPLTIDHKSTTRFGMVFDAMFKLSGQFTGYMKGGSKIIGREIHTALANAIRITTRLDDSSFVRIYTHRTPEEFTRWEQEVRHVYSRILEYRYEYKSWPRYAPFACGAYNRVCEFYMLCIASQQTRETLIETAYEKLVWNPREEVPE